MIGISCFLIGPSYLLRSILPDKIGIMIPGLLITGLFTSFTTIGTYQEMQLPFLELHGGSEEDAKSPNDILYDKDKLGDILAGLYNGGYSLGVIIGPFSASYLQIWLEGSFSKQSDFFGILTLFFATLLLCSVYIPNEVRRRRKKR